MAYLTVTADRCILTKGCISLKIGNVASVTFVRWPGVTLRFRMLPTVVNRPPPTTGAGGCRRAPTSPPIAQISHNKFTSTRTLTPEYCHLTPEGSIMTALVLSADNRTVVTNSWTVVFEPDGSAKISLLWLSTEGDLPSAVGVAKLDFPLELREFLQALETVQEVRVVDLR